MLHRLTIPALILRDFELRAVFPRYRTGEQHPMMDDISVKAGTDDLKRLLEDAEARAAMDRYTKGYYPNLKRAYSRFVEKLRAILRSEPGDNSTGRVGKEAAAGEDVGIDFSKVFNYD